MTVLPSDLDLKQKSGQASLKLVDPEWRMLLMLVLPSIIKTYELRPTMLFLGEDVQNLVMV
jgi:hypothetical protein